MSQPTLSAYFSLRKRPVDAGHAAKKRKVVDDIEDTTTTTNSKEKDEPVKALATSFSSSSLDQDASTPSTAPATPPTRPRRATPSRGVKRPQRGAAHPQTSATVNTATPELAATEAKPRAQTSSAKKRLDYAKGSAKTPAKELALAPAKELALAPAKELALAPAKEVAPAPEKLSTRTPAKELTPIPAKIPTPAPTPNPLSRLNPDKVRVKLGQTGQLAELQAKLRKLHNLKIPAPTPKTKPVPKAPEKLVDFGSKTSTCPSAGLPVLPSTMPLPESHVRLVKVFQALDNVVRLRHNRGEAIRVSELRDSVQKATSRDFSESDLCRIHHLFPTAFRYKWEQQQSKYSGVRRQGYELLMAPNLDYSQKTDGPSSSSELYGPTGSGFARMTPKELQERERIMRRALADHVLEEHQKFLAALTPPIEVDPSKLTNWHSDFPLHSCPEVPEAALPEKPDQVRLTKAKDVLAATSKLFGLNKRLEEAVLAAKEKEKEEDKLTSDNPTMPANPPKVKKGLEGLPPSLLKKILEKEKAKQLRTMVEPEADKRAFDMLDNLQRLAPLLLNCYHSERRTHGKGALETAAFFAYCAQCHGRKDAREVEVHARMLFEKAPDVFEVFSVRKTEYVKLRANAPTRNELVDRLAKMAREVRK